jgi:DNA-binding transcriptional ArsR family regulator
MKTRIELAAGFLAAVANPKRLLILDTLIKQEFSVGDLAKRVELSKSALSQHLAKLRMAGLVSTRREAQTFYYSCHVDAVAALLDLVLSFYPPESLSVRS